MGDGGNPREWAGRALRNERWVVRRNIAFTWVCWLILTVAALYVASRIIHALLLLLVACLVAYALYPLVERLRRFMPRWLALLAVYLLLMAVIGGFGYLLVTTAVTQLVALANQVKVWLTPGPNGTASPLMKLLQSWGISAQQIASAEQDILNAVQSWTSQIVPVLSGIVNAVLDFVLMVVLSIYLLLDGARVATWANTRTPLRVRTRVTSFLETLQLVVGGYIRGQLALCGLIGVLVGVGMALFQVPYAVLLGVLAFILEFIPVIGVLISGALCVLLALTHGWVVAVGVLIYFIGVQVIEGDVIGPRIVGRAVGLHPIISITALVAGGELFGIWGALLAAPAAGLAQAVLVEAWAAWRKQNPDQFDGPEDAANPVTAIAEAAADSATDTALHPEEGESDETDEHNGDETDEHDGDETDHE